MKILTETLHMRYGMTAVVANGLGDSASCFTAHALEDWRNLVQPVSEVGYKRHREQVYALANQAFLHPVDLLLIVQKALREERLQHK